MVLYNRLYLIEDDKALNISSAVMYRRYFQTDKNDLLYWGLDYPPLTAYVSYLFGLVAHHVLPDLVAL